MKLIALMPVRNEQWVLAASVTRALQWCDAIVILDHDSTDDTPQIIREMEERYPDRVLTRVRGGAWAEMEHRQALLEAGRLIGGTHFALVDADEIITGELLPIVRKIIESLLPGQCLDVPMLPIWNDLEHVRSDDCVWTRAMLTLAFCDAPELNWRPRSDGYQHHHRAPFDPVKRTECIPGGIPRPLKRLQKHTPGVMHLQFADRGRLRAKHALYKMQEVLRWPGRESVGSVDAKYSMALDESGLERKLCPTRWWDGVDKKLIKIGEEPWQRDETKRLIGLHGAEVFKGLELWGETE